MDLSTVLVIPDLQMPYEHVDTFSFLTEIKKQFKPTHVIQGGDLEDFHCFNFHGVDPSLPSAVDELKLLRQKVKRLAALFPAMQILDSNHGALPKRKAKSVGIPDELLKDERSILQAPSTWTWHKELVLKLPSGMRVKFVHNFSSNVLQSSKDQAMSLIQFHFHSKSELHWWSTGERMFFASTVGCLIDDEHRAFSYNKTQAKRPVYTCMVIKNGIPIIIPMHVNSRKRWVGYI